MKIRISRKELLQWGVVLLTAYGLKLFYSTATANELRWILAPTTWLVEILTSDSFQFESNSGYINQDRSFLIAPVCAGINFLIAAFLMLTAYKLLKDRERTPWRALPQSMAIAFISTIIANTIRIGVALELGFNEMGAFDHHQLHRIEGISIYFGCLLMLFVISERLHREATNQPLTRMLFPLLVYYATAVGIPLINGGYRHGIDFWQHSLFVLVVPLALIVPLAVAGSLRQRLRSEHHPMEAGNV